MEKRIGLVVLTVLALGILSAGALFAASFSNGDRIPFLGSNVELNVAKPFEITLVRASSTADFPGRVYSGQKIAEGILTISNVSPFDYGASVRAEPQKVLGEQQPWFEVKIGVGNTIFQGPKVIPAGATIGMKIEVFIPYGAPVSSFQGLDIIVDAVPPPTETITTCPASRCD